MVEDIEALNFDHYGRYEEQQKDWRFVLEEVAAFKRGKYTNTLSLHQMRLHCLNPHYYEAEKLFMGHEDSENLREVESLVSERSPIFIKPYNLKGSGRGNFLVVSC